jgi:hypothetical protein
MEDSPYLIPASSASDSKISTAPCDAKPFCTNLHPALNRGSRVTAGAVVVALLLLEFDIVDDSKQLLLLKQSIAREMTSGITNCRFVPVDARWICISFSRNGRRAGSFDNDSLLYGEEFIPISTSSMVRVVPLAVVFLYITSSHINMKC